MTPYTLKPKTQPHRETGGQGRNDEPESDIIWPIATIPDFISQAEAA